MSADRTIATRRAYAADLCAALALCLVCWGAAESLASEPVRVQVLWEAESPTTWQGSIASGAASISDFRPLGVSPDEPDVFRVEERNIDAIPGVERLSDGCEFAVDADANLSVEIVPAGANAVEALSADVAVTELLGQPEGVTVNAAGRSLTVRRAPQDRLKVEPSAPKQIYEAGAAVSFVSRHRTEQATAVPLTWKASLISLRDGAVAWSKETTTEPLAAGAESRLEWEVALPDVEGVYRLLVEAYPRKFGSRWYRGEAALSGCCDLVTLAEASPVSMSKGEPHLVITPGERSWRERVSSVSPVRWLGFSSDESPGDEGDARIEQDGESSWLVLEPGAVRAFSLPPNLGRRGKAVEIDVASGEPGTVEVACRQGPGADGVASEDSSVSWRAALVIPDLPVPAPTASPVETLRVLLPIAAGEGTLFVRAADPKRPLRVAQIRIVDEGFVSVSATDREFASMPGSRTATLVVEDVNWPSRLSDGLAPANLSPRISTRLKWYEAALRLARYAKAEGYDRVCVPAIAEGGALFSLPRTSLRLIEGEQVAPSEIGSPVDALEILLSVFDRERIDVTLAYSPDLEESFDAATMLRRWEESLDRGASHSSFRGCVLRLPASRFDAHATAQRATEEDLRQFERALGLTLPTDAALRASSLSRHGALWGEWQATRTADQLKELSSTAIARKIERFVEIGSDASASGVQGPPASLSVLERSGWTLWRRGDFRPTAPAAIATQPVRFSGLDLASDTAPPELWLRRASEVGEAFACRIDSLSERRLLAEFALRDVGGSVESDRFFAPTLDPELSRLRRTLSSLPTKRLLPASRRTPLGDEPLRVRAVRDEQGLYVVAVNLAPWAIRAEVEFGPGKIGTMRSLGDRSLSPPAVSAGAVVWTLDLAPFDVVAVRFDGGESGVVDWKKAEPPPLGIEQTEVRAAIDDLSRRLSVASDPFSRPSLFRDSFDRHAEESSNWRVDRTEGADFSRRSADGSQDGSVAIAPGGGSLRLTTSALQTPATRSATVSIIARVATDSGEAPATSNPAPVVRLVALSGVSSVATHVSARVDLAVPSTSGRPPDASEWRQIYVPIENLPESFWQNWTVTLEVVGEGTLLVDEFTILDGYPSPERLSAWRKQLAIAEYALRERRMFAAYEALTSPSMRFVRGSFDPVKREVPSGVPSVAIDPPTADVADAEAPPAAEPPEERGMWERLWNWAPEPVFR